MLGLGYGVLVQGFGVLAVWGLGQGLYWGLGKGLQWGLGFTKKKYCFFSVSVRCAGKCPAIGTGGESSPYVALAEDDCRRRATNMISEPSDGEPAGLSSLLSNQTTRAGHMVFSQGISLWYRLCGTSS